MSEMVMVTLQKKPHGVFASAIYRVDKGYEVTEAPETRMCKDEARAFAVEFAARHDCGSEPNHD